MNNTRISTHLNKRETQEFLKSLTESPRTYTDTENGRDPYKTYEIEAGDLTIIVFTPGD